jgi:tetratricopeptide (TPR) repeat protein
MRRPAVFRLILLLFCFPVLRQAHPAEPQKAADAQSTKPRLGQAGSQEELDAYNHIRSERDAATKKRLIDQFVLKYQASGLLVYVYQDGVYLARQLGDIEMMAEYGEKALELWNDNYPLLTDLGSAYVHRNRIAEAEKMAGRALQAIASAEKPAYMTESQWGESVKMLKACNLTTMGFVHLRRAQASTDPALRLTEAEIAINPFERALELNPRDDFALYGLGFTWTIQNHYAQAESNLAKAVALNGAVMASARRILEEIYKSRHNQSLEGLEQVIAKAKTELGLF